MNVERVYKNRHGLELIDVKIGSTVYTLTTNDAEILARDVLTAVRIFRAQQTSASRQVELTCEAMAAVRTLIEQAERAFENLDLTQGELADALLTAIEGAEAVVAGGVTGVILPVILPVTPRELSIHERRADG